MELLIAVHGFVRWPVLVTGLAGLIHGSVAWSQGVGAPRLDRVLGAVFLGLLDLQAVLGIAVFALRAQSRAEAWPHAAIMIVAVALAHVVRALTRRAHPAKRRRLVFAQFLAPLALIVAGLLVGS